MVTQQTLFFFRVNHPILGSTLRFIEHNRTNQCLFAMGESFTFMGDGNPTRMSMARMAVRMGWLRQTENGETTKMWI